jgi:hypothetical protein
MFLQVTLVRTTIESTSDVTRGLTPTLHRRDSLIARRTENLANLARRVTVVDLVPQPLVKLELADVAAILLRAQHLLELSQLKIVLEPEVVLAITTRVE